MGELAFQSEPLKLPKTRREHLGMQIQWNNEMVGHLLKRKAELLKEVEGIDGQVQSVRGSSDRLYRQLNPHVPKERA